MESYESDTPSIFDPFGDYCPDFSNYEYDIDSQQILDGQGHVYNSSIIPTLQAIVDQGEDPQPSLKQLLEAEFENSKPAPQDPTDIMPTYTHKKLGDYIYFPDCSFAGPHLRSEQECKTKELGGYLILPAKYCTRIRSRQANHNVPTPVLYVPQICAEIDEIFE